MGRRTRKQDVSQTTGAAPESDLGTAAALIGTAFKGLAAKDAIPVTWEERAVKAWEFYQEEPLVANAVNAWRSFALGDEITIRCDDEDVQTEAMELYWRLGLNGFVRDMVTQLLVKGDAIGYFVRAKGDDIERVMCVNPVSVRFRYEDDELVEAIQYRYMQADMYNLYPAIGEVNELRSNYSMAMIQEDNHRFGACKTEIEDGKIEPRPEIRGDIARTYFYMESAYPGHGIMAGANKKLFEAWDKTDPVDAWECERARRIARIQGNINLVIERACKAAGQ